MNTQLTEQTVPSETQAGEIPSLISSEIERIDKALRQKDRELAAMMMTHTTRLGLILQAKRDRIELDAYLRGLNFIQLALGR